LGAPNHHKEFCKIVPGPAAAMLGFPPGLTEVMLTLGPLGRATAAGEPLVLGKLFAFVPLQLGEPAGLHCAEMDEPRPAVGRGTAGFAEATPAGMRIAAAAIAHAAVPV
jgi:hypothetical protein